eukprot:TRINITY_DN76344_c0_g1_i1.p1 TRINITY_DN76344_c0_g1~~TRINITY_DN76344_c0_g1_i1.p1  ORF type:complete len:505 (-),score=41.39 TRINITY_DN76344_c0_g1_i1:83-1597(-)
MTLCSMRASAAAAPLVCAQALVHHCCRFLGTRTWPLDLPEAQHVPFGKRNCARCGCACSLPERSPATRQQVAELEFVSSRLASSSLVGERRARSCVSPRKLVPLRASSPLRWRTRVKFAVGPDLCASADGCAIGLFEVGTRKVVQVDDCQIHHAAISRALQPLRAALADVGVEPYSHDADRPDRIGALRHVQLTVERATSQVQLALVWNANTADEAPLSRSLVARLLDKEADRRTAASSPLWHSFWAHFRGYGGDNHGSGVIWGGVGFGEESWQHYSGPFEVVETIDGLPFRFGPAVFRQPNLEVFDKIVRDMKEVLVASQRVGLGGGAARWSRPPNILEICGGVGVLGISLASVAGPGTILLSTDANMNCMKAFAANARAVLGPAALDAGSVSFRHANAVEAAGFAGAEAFDVVVVDPPRSGLGREAIRRLASAASVRTLLYLSCSPRSFCEDAEGLVGGGFSLDGLRCYDSFPGTAHVELLGVFVRDQAMGHLRRSVSKSRY